MFGIDNSISFMKLYLVQHGDALGAEENPERPLSEKGRGDVEKMASFLARSGVRPAHIIHSGKARARETAVLLAQTLGTGGLVEETDAPLGPNDATDPLIGLIDGWDEDVLIVGHLPFMGRVASHLLIGRPDVTMVSFEPGAIACLENNSGEQWTLAWMIRPSLFGGGLR